MEISFSLDLSTFLLYNIQIMVNKGPRNSDWGPDNGQDYLEEKYHAIKISPWISRCWYKLYQQFP